jgi:hypothetical protein
MLAPIVLFTFNRPAHVKAVVEALKKNFQAEDSDLIIFSDGCRNETDKDAVNRVRNYVNGLSGGFKTIKVHISEYNKGADISIIEGVSEVIRQYGKVIVLEDDLICTPNFLSYMNGALDFYQADSRIFSVCGYGLKIKRPPYYPADVYLFGRSSSWGWGTWVNRWETVDWDVKDWAVFSKDAKAKKAFNRNGSDMYSMLKRCMEGENHPWDIRFCYAQFKQGKYSVFPFLSKIDNIGFGKGATHTKHKYNRFRTTLDTSCRDSFVFPKDILPDKNIIKSCRQYHGIFIRAYSKIRYLLNV